MSSPHRRRSARSFVAASCIAFALSVAMNPASADTPLPEPSPVDILGRAVLRTPPLDALSLCVPARLASDLRKRVREAARRPESALEMARALDSEGDAKSDAPLLAALLMGRAASDDAARRKAIVGLAPWRRSSVGPEAEMCARLETARLELQRGRLPEAAGQARMAGRRTGHVSGGQALLRATDFYRAEALLLAGRHREARAIYRRLTSGTSDRVSAAARLRFADALFDGGKLKGARIEYEALLPDAGNFGASVGGWGLRAIEAALAAGDLRAARHWAETLLEGDSPPAVQSLARVRLSDVLISLENREGARAELERVLEADAEQLEPVTRLAALRLEDLAAGQEEALGDERIARLKALIAAGPRPHADVARLLLAAARRLRGEYVEALNLLSRVAIGPMSTRLSEPLRKQLDATLGAMAAEAAGHPERCADFVTHVGWRRRLLAKRAGSAKPFAELGSCYAIVGLEAQAIEIYEAVTRDFGSEGAAQIALPLARVSLARGNLEAARRAALPRAKEPGEAGDRWRLLLSETEMFDGRYHAASETLRDLVSRDRPATGGDRVRAIVLLARATSHLSTAAEFRHVLGDAIRRLDSEARRARGDWVGEAALIAAEGHRGAGDRRSARELYRVALDVLPAGDRREQAAYWLSVLGSDAGLSEGQGGIWQRLAEVHRGAESLRTRLRRPLEAPKEPTG